MTLPSPTKIFIAYARLDTPYLEQLRKHLYPLEINKMVEVWYDGVIAPGEQWEQHIKDNLKAAQIILLLVSVNSLYSKYFYNKEVTAALEKHQKGEAIVIPIILDHCMWDITPLAQLQALPKDGIPIEDWDKANKAYHNVVRGIHERIKELKAKEKAAKLAAEKCKKEEVEKQKAAKLLAEKRQKEKVEKQKVAEAKRLREIEEQKRIAQLHPKVQKLLQDMVFIEGGSFQMGREENHYCQPVHPVIVPNFEMAKYPVTQAQWRAVMGSNPPELRFKGCDKCPVESVNWNEAKEFIQKLNELTGKTFRLPSESEWEFAARGGKKSKGFLYAGSDDIGEVAWYNGNSGSKMHPVGQLKANELGLYDMSGNVWEWCEDDWHENYKNAPKNGRAWIESKRISHRVLRGGSWINGYNCRVANRGRNNPFSDGYNIGFRCAKTP